ncbi:MAG: hypothetical protein IPM89_14315 [Candidatus Competibacteraceae bacterium]|nr:MAG: hypothetical protein IPM89_14315 [Candidatus Competibacteraceae bacterium]
MDEITHYPFLVFALSLVVLWFSAWIGRFFLRHRKQGKLDPEVREDLNIILAATLTLLGLIIGFSFSMAIERYDQRKNYEEAEANAISTEYVRIDLLSAADAVKIRILLRNYLDQRVLFYRTHYDRLLQQKVNIRTAQLQNELWSAIQAPAAAQPTPIVALVVSGMNDVLNSQGYTQAAFWNRIPTEAWGLMAVIAIFCNVLVGYGLRDATEKAKLLPILPLVVSIAFMLIADIDAPRHGIIHVAPQNLISLAESMHAH